MKERFGLLVGYSDHTPDVWTALGAAVVGAKAIEKHFTLDRSLKGPDHHVSVEPHEFLAMVQAIRKLEAALGSEKKVHAEEEPVSKWAHHSVVSLCDIRAGTVISREMVGVKRPGLGISAKHLEEIYGRVAKRDISANSVLHWEDVGIEQK